LAFTKNKKGEMIADYEKWLDRSQAVFVLSYDKMNMKEIDTFRAKVREAGSETHLVKNTLFERVLENKGFPKSEYFETTSMVGFAFGDIASLAKVFTETAKGSEVIRVKGGFLGKEQLSDRQIKELADLPPMPVMRGILLGVISAPATKFVRTLAEPARSMAAVVKAYSEKAGTAA
jgi:large subunit ribosomal protein L10